MGIGIRLGNLLFILCFVFLTGQSFGRNTCAENVKIYSLPVGEVIPGVESINEARAEELVLYNRGASVNGQIRQRQVFGYVAVRGEDEILGFAVIERRSNYFAILNIAVAKGSEHQGIGSELVNHILDEANHAQGIDEVRTLVAYNDEGARKFFGSNEFAETEVIAGKFERGALSGVMMKKILHDRAAEAAEAQLQLQPKPQPKKVSVAVQVIDIPMAELRRLDPTLEHATDFD